MSDRPATSSTDGYLRSLERDFGETLAKFNVGTRPGWGTDPGVDLAREDGAFYLCLHRRLAHSPEQMREAAGVQLGLLDLGYLDPGAPPWWDDPDYERTNKRRWRAALLWASKRLVHDRTLGDAVREGWTVQRLAAEAQVTHRVAQVRMREAAKLPPFFSG